MERSLCQRKTLKVCFSLFCCLLLSLVFSFFSVNKAYAIDGNGQFSVVENWNSYLDGSWHYNVSDGAVSIPHALIRQSGSQYKALSWFRYRLGLSSGDYIGDTDNLYNSVVLEFRHQNTNAINSWNISNSTYSPSITFTLSDNSTKVGTCTSAVRGTNDQYLIITCGVVAENHNQIKAFDFNTGYQQSTDQLQYLTAGNNGFAVQLDWIKYSYSGSTDPNTALLQLQNSLIEEQNEKIDNIYNYLQNQTENQRQEDQQTADDMVDDVEVDPNIGAVEAKTTSILTLLGQVLTAITNPTAGNCIIPFDISNYAGGTSTNVDLCHLSPPAGITTVLNIIFVGFVILMAISAVKTIFRLYKEATTN